MDKTVEVLLSDYVAPIITNFVVPKIASSIKQKLTRKEDDNKIQNYFEVYITQSYEKNSVIETLVFPNKQIPIKSIYEPLTVIEDIDNPESVKVKIDGYPIDFLPKYYRIIIEDTAGMGKSTISKIIFLAAIENKVGIPILIQLRNIDDKNSIIAEIQNQITPIQEETISYDLLYSMIDQGDFIFIFDGFDEISEEQKKAVIIDLHKFISKANNNLYLITSRPEDSLVSFGDFMKFSVKPLDQKESQKIIHRYDLFNFQQIAAELLKQIEEQKNESLGEYLKNPFLVSLLYKSFDYKKNIPIKKTQFYEQVFDALFEAHDLSKEGYLKRNKHSNLHRDDFGKVLRYVAYFSSIKNEVKYDKNKIIYIIDKVKAYMPDLDFKSSDFLKDLLETVPLFQKDGIYFKWAHKSLQDYFAAKYIWNDSKDNRISILKKIYEDQENMRFYNLLDLYYELDKQGFESTILFWLLEDFEIYLKNERNKYSNIPIEKIVHRLELCYNTNHYIVLSTQNEYNILKEDEGIDISDTLVERVNNKLNKKIQEHSGSYFYFEKPQIMSITFHCNKNRNIDTILKIIHDKDKKLVNYEIHNYKQKKLPALLVEGEVYIIDSLENNIINNEIIFEYINHLLVSGYKLSSKYAYEKLEQLRKIDTLIKKDEFLDW